MRYDHLGMLPENAFSPIGRIMTLEGGKGGSTPKAPNYEKLAQQEAQNQLALNRSTTQANRVDQYTPWGSLTYQQGTGGQYFDQAGYDAAQKSYETQLNALNNQDSYKIAHDPWAGTGSEMWRRSGGNASLASANALSSPDRNSFYKTGNPDQWSSTMTLNPEVQKILDQTLSGQQQGYSELQNYLKNIQDSSRIPGAVVNPGQTAQQAIMARLNPSFQNREEDLRTRLYNQGVRPGTEAWDNEYRNFGQERNDAFSQAALQGISLDEQARARALQEQSLPMNAIQAYLNNTQVQSPQFTDYAQQAQTGAADLMGAAQGTYGAQMNAANAKNAQAAQTTSGLFSLAGLALMSDRRLKKNIQKIGTYHNGLNKYSFEYLWGAKAIGAMADEVEKIIPQAVGRIGEFKTVNYAMLGE
jgi:hypothetical protein